MRPHFMRPCIRIGSALLLALLVMGIALLAGCGAGGQAGSSTSGKALSPYTAIYNSFDSSEATGSAGALIDTSSVDGGVVGAKARSGSRLKFQVVHGDTTYNYDLSSSGTAEFFPLQSGDGTYQFRIMQNTSGSKYVELYSTSATVKLSSETAPFLRPNQFVDYSADSTCVAKADQLRSQATTDLDLVAKIYDYVSKNVKYDYDKAASVESGYVPDPDTTLATGKGICFDYASLAGAMMRSQGIPCKVMTGYVAPDDIYHSWNIIYTESAGWISVDIQVKSGKWARIDTTFASTTGNNTASTKKTYTDRYTY